MTLILWWTSQKQTLTNQKKNEGRDMRGYHGETLLNPGDNVEGQEARQQQRKGEQFRATSVEKNQINHWRTEHEESTRMRPSNEIPVGKN